MYILPVAILPQALEGKTQPWPQQRAMEFTVPKASTTMYVSDMCLAYPWVLYLQAWLLLGVWQFFELLFSILVNIYCPFMLFIWTAKRSVHY